jgi:hypothetical protein
MFAGMAFGPTIGSLLIRATETIISVFYLTTFVHLVYAGLIFIVIPEPLSKGRMKESQRRYAEELRESEEATQNGPVSWKVRAKRLFKFLSPLGIFLPSFVDNTKNPLKRKERDWTLALLAVAYGFTISIIVSHELASMFYVEQQFIFNFPSGINTLRLPIRHNDIRLVNRDRESLHSGERMVAKEVISWVTG